MNDFVFICVIAAIGVLLFCSVAISMARAHVAANRERWKRDGVTSAVREAGAVIGSWVIRVDRRSELLDIDPDVRLKLVRMLKDLGTDVRESLLKLNAVPRPERPVTRAG